VAHVLGLFIEEHPFGVEMGLQKMASQYEEGH
jgi:hypothetical protein